MRRPAASIGSPLPHVTAPSMGDPVHPADPGHPGRTRSGEIGRPPVTPLPYRIQSAFHIMAPQAINPAHRPGSPRPRPAISANKSLGTRCPLSKASLVQPTLSEEVHHNNYLKPPAGICHQLRAACVQSSSRDPTTGAATRPLTCTCEPRDQSRDPSGVDTVDSRC